MTVPQSRTPPVHRALTRHARAARPFIVGRAVLGVLAAASARSRSARPCSAACAPGSRGGERQRIGVARALLADRPILLLDEPTAHLDALTATALAADLRTLATGRAALIVTHRPGEFDGLPSVRLGARAAEVPLSARRRE